MRPLWLALPLLALVVAGNAQASSYLSCFYTSRGPSAEFEEHRDCARPVGDGYRIRKSHLAQMSLDRHGLAAVRIAQQYFYVRPDGRMLPVLAFDNGPDDFAEGLTRSRIEGKIAYYDTHFRQVIAPRYDWGSPFRNGRAEVCNGCRPQPPDADGHAAIIGGLWGSIDKRGREIVPLALPDRNAP